MSLIEFTGAVSCEALRGGRDWRLCGVARQGGAEPASQAVQLMIIQAAADSAVLPAQLHELRVQVSDALRAEAGRALQLAAREGSYRLSAAAVRLHRDASPAFFRVVPPPRVPLLTRAGWALLLTLLRLPLLYKRLIHSTG